MRRKTKAVLICLALLATFLWTEVARSPKGDDSVHLYFFDVGQGDAALIQKDGYQILVDGGPDDKILTELGKVMPLSDHEIEVMILSHPHADHLAGLNQVLDRYQINKIYASGVSHTADGYLDFLQKIKDKNIEMKIPAIDESMTPYENGKLEFLWPGDQYQEKTIDNLNNASLVNRFCYFERCSMFGGDIETDEQTRMFDYYSKINIDPYLYFKSDILKALHHGSNNGSNGKLFEIVGPSYFVISAGADNKYGHPHKYTLDLVEKYQSRLLRTDRDGTVQFRLGKDGVVQSY